MQSILYEEPRQVPVDDVLARGKQAERLLKDPVLTEAMQEAERDLLIEWRASDDPEEREALHAELAFPDRLLRMLNAMVQDGEVLQHILDTEKAAEQALSME